MQHDRDSQPLGCGPQWDVVVGIQTTSLRVGAQQSADPSQFHGTGQLLRGRAAVKVRESGEKLQVSPPTRGLRQRVGQRPAPRDLRWRRRRGLDHVDPRADDAEVHGPVQPAPADE